jgi:hypothetical protein
MRVSTETIYTICENETFGFRQANDLAIDEAHQFAHLDDLGGVVPIESGLQARDFAVFLQFKTPTETKSVGYFVGAVDPKNEGSGTLVCGDTLETRAQELMTPELLAKLQYLGGAGICLANDFNLPALAAFVGSTQK